MENTSKYIKPIISFYPSFTEASSADLEFDKYIASEKEWEFRELFNYPKTFVVAEPGYGKTRFLQEIASGAVIEGYKAIPPIECKKIIEPTVKEHILKHSKKIDGFELDDKENIVICLDALDEVRVENFSQTVEKIKTFLDEYKRTNVIISCRWHFFQKYKELFNDLDFRYLRIFNFSREQVQSYLEKSFIPHKDIENILGLLSFRGRALVIQTPRYLELLVDYIKELGIKDLQHLTRAKLFEFFIYKKLEVEDKKLNTQKRDLIKRVLEKVALVMEIYQSNLLSKDELMTFFDDLKSDLKMSLLQQISLEVFFDKTVLKDNIDTIEFDNTEFQEYLAAKEIIRLGKNIRTIYELSIDPEIREIYPSWFNTLGFVVDLDISILRPLLDFGLMIKEGITQDEEYHRFLTKVNVECLPVEERRTIFEQVFTYYQSFLHWIDWDIAKNLSYYFDKSQLDLIKYYSDGRRFKNNETKRIVHSGNVAQIVGFILERDIFDNKEKAYWKQKLIKFAEDKNENGVLQRNALSALGNLGDDTVIRKVESVWKSKDKLIRDRFLELCREINPNHDLSIKYFVEGVKQESIYARYGLYKINESQAVKKLLDDFIHDSSFLEQFIDRESIFKDKDETLIENIEAVWDSDIKSKLQIIVQKAFESAHWYQARDSKFIRNIALLLNKRNKSYLFDLISQIAKSNNLKKNLYGFQNLFSTLLEKEQVEEFVNQLLHFDKGKLDALWTLQQIKSSKRADAEEIYEEGRNYLSNEYKETESKWEKLDKKPSEEERLYDEFRLKLEPEEGKYYPDVFEFYLNNKDTLKPLITKDEKDRLKSLVEGSVFNHFDPGEHDLKITEIKGGGTSYTTPSWIHIFGDCIQVASELNLDIIRYRTKIINYIPFAYSEHLDAIFSLVKDVQPDEIKSLLAVFKRKESDLWRFMPDSFIQTSERYVIKDAVPVLKEFVAQNDFSIYDRISALNTSEFLKPDAGFLKKVFEQYKEEQEKLAERANELLIAKHKDAEAVTWRFDELVKSAFSFKEQVGVHKVGPQEHELRDKEFAAPLMKLKYPQYEQQFLGLLDKSFNILKKKGYWPYAQYLWQIACAYFDNLKEERSYRPLRDLEKFVEEHSSDEGINWFKYRLKELKRSYVIFIGKPTSIRECIQKYNKLKTQQYMEIATPYDLNEKVKDIIDKDLRRWIESEGAYSFIIGEKIKETKKQDYEDFIQKTIKTQIENALLKKGLKETDIIREPQLLDGRRTDFLISYGFIGPVLLELKLTTNPDLGPNIALQGKASYKNLGKYMKGFNAHFGIFLVIDIKERVNGIEGWKLMLKKIEDAYQQIENVKVYGLKCIQI